MLLKALLPLISAGTKHYGTKARQHELSRNTLVERDVSFLYCTQLYANTPLKACGNVCIGNQYDILCGMYSVH